MTNLNHKSPTKLQEDSNVISFDQKKLDQKRERIDNKDNKDIIDNIEPVAESDRGRQNVCDLLDVKAPTSPVDTYWANEWETFYSSVSEKDFFFLGTSLFDNGTAKKRNQRFKICMEYLTEGGSTDWTKIIFTIPLRQRDVKYNLPQENGVSLWEHHYYQNLVAISNIFKIEGRDNNWIIKPTVIKAHEHTAHTNKKHGMGAVIPFVGGVVYWAEGKNPCFNLHVGGCDFALEMKPIKQGNKIAKAEWRQKERPEQKFGKLKL